MKKVLIIIMSLSMLISMVGCGDVFKDIFNEEIESSSEITADDLSEQEKRILKSLYNTCVSEELGKVDLSTLKILNISNVYSFKYKKKKLPFEDFCIIEVEFNELESNEKKSSIYGLTLSKEGMYNDSVAYFGDFDEWICGSVAETVAAIKLILSDGDISLKTEKSSFFISIDSMNSYWQKVWYNNTDSENESLQSFAASKKNNQTTTISETETSKKVTTTVTKAKATIGNNSGSSSNKTTTAKKAPSISGNITKQESPYEGYDIYINVSGSYDYYNYKYYEKSMGNSSSSLIASGKEDKATPHISHIQTRR